MVTMVWDWKDDHSVVSRYAFDFWFWRSAGVKYFDTSGFWFVLSLFNFRWQLVIIIQKLSTICFQFVFMTFCIDPKRRTLRLRNLRSHSMPNFSIALSFLKLARVSTWWEYSESSESKWNVFNSFIPIRKHLPVDFNCKSRSLRSALLRSSKPKSFEVKFTRTLVSWWKFWFV